ncbi:MAG: RNA 2',3'-cyclic phosphodiesterase [Myxococcota bacterium]
MEQTNGGRTFLALYPPDEALNEMIELSERFISSLGASKNLRVVKREQYHLTLRFFEHLTDSERNDYISALSESIGGSPPLNLSISALGGFPHINNPRVFWIGLKPIEAIRELFARVESAAEVAGLPLERRGLKPHITIARAKIVKPIKNAREVAEKIPLPKTSRVWNELKLMDSKLASAGALHSPIAGWRLTG